MSRKVILWNEREWSKNRFVSIDNPGKQYSAVVKDVVLYPRGYFRCTFAAEEVMFGHHRAFILSSPKEFPR